MQEKRRISASVDADLFSAAERSVAGGSAASISAWVNEAMRRQLEHEQRIAALDVFLAAFEAEFGVISENDIVSATKRSRANAVSVRGAKKTRSVRKRSA